MREERRGKRYEGSDKCGERWRREEGEEKREKI